MSPKELLLKLSKKGRVGCSPSGCPLYNLFLSKEDHLDEMYSYFIKKPKLKDLSSRFSCCSETFLYLCYTFDKKKAKRMFEKYDDGNNFYLGNTQMPCFLLKEMAETMLQERILDIE
jgi:hypothetical protein